MVLVSLHFVALVVHVYEGPALNALSPLVFSNLNVLKYLTLLLLGAAEVLELLLEPIVGHLRFLNLQLSLTDKRPINLGKERMPFDLQSSFNSCSETFAWVPVEEVDDQVLCLDRHAHWEFQNSSLYVMKQFSPKIKSKIALKGVTYFESEK